MPTFHPPHTFWRHHLTGVFLLGLAFCAQSQNIYRHIGPDGRITFSDRAPQTVQQASPANSRRVIAAESDAAYDLPNALRAPVARYPVTFYSFSGCVTCDEARRFLRHKGIPFQEKTVNTDADKAAFAKISPSGTMPVATIGNQQLTGFQQEDWDSYLKAAGYPQNSVLPSGYMAPAPTALVEPQPAPAAAPTEAVVEPTPDLEATPARNTADNPAGIRF